VEIIQKFTENDARFKLIKQQVNNISTARNTAILASSGKYILPLDSDDLIHPDYVREAVEILENNPKVAVVTCDAQLFGAKRGKWKRPEYNFKDFLVKVSIHNTSMYRRADYDKTNGYEPDLMFCEDWEFWINLLKMGGDVYKIEKRYLYYRRHNDSTQKKFRHSEAENEFVKKFIYEKHKEIYAPLLENPLELLQQHQKYKKGYNQLRRLTFRKPLP
jgi:glycosyltransferase involved in cell wall biosynthesis